MKDTAPLLTATGPAYNRRSKGPLCTKRQIIVSLVIFCTIALVLGLVLGLAVDWGGDDAQVIQPRNNQYWQTQFASLPSNDSCKETVVALGSKPHVAGYPEQIETGDYVYELFESLPGIEPFKQEWNNTVLDRFVSSSLKMTLNESAGWIELDIAEEILEVDPDTNTSLATHIWNAYSANGTVTGNIVYINFGRRGDYEQLIMNDNYTTITSNASFANKIGLVRYGMMGRSSKVKIAQEYGIIGLIMFSDPQQYANGTEPVYPDGPWLPPTGVQRGSIKYASCPGNPEIERLQTLCGIDNIDDALPTIPVMPLSYSNAEILFENMADGDVAPEGWAGDIDVDYMIDSEDLLIELSVETDLNQNALTQNVYGIMKGDEEPDQIVIIGGHRDSWVCGAQDDVSGVTTVLEVARGFSKLYEDGWRPRRTMIFATWDSEESGLIGSVFFGEHLDMFDFDDLPLEEGLIAYINLDMTTGDDIFDIAGNPLLRTVCEDAMKSTPLENPKFPNLDTFYDKFVDQGENWGILGQGSDHTVFAYYLGVAAMDTGFGGPKAWGAYHSMYDTVRWQETVDPDWMLAEDIARFAGVLTMKLLDSKVIPFDLYMLANTMKEWFTVNLMNAMNTTFDCDPDELLSQNVTYELLDALDEFEGVAMELTEFVSELSNRTNAMEDEEMDEDDVYLVDKVNELMSVISKQFNYEQGLPARTWHKNILWNTPIEDGESNVFPYIWYALQYECEEEMVRTAFEVTQGIIDDATGMLQDYLGNVTQS